MLTRHISSESVDSIALKGKKLPILAFNILWWGRLAAGSQLQTFPSPIDTKIVSIHQHLQGEIVRKTVICCTFLHL